jgi:hypothetical protein
VGAGVHGGGEGVAVHGVIVALASPRAAVSTHK